MMRLNEKTLLLKLYYGFEFENSDQSLYSPKPRSSDGRTVEVYKECNEINTVEIFANFFF